jgi:hypothetical protein
MALYTFFCERGGGTYISQFERNTLVEAWNAFVPYEDARSGVPLNLEFDDPANDIVVVSEVQSVWCGGALDENDDYVSVHIIKTDVSGPEEGKKV